MYVSHDYQPTTRAHAGFWSVLCLAIGFACGQVQAAEEYVSCWVERPDGQLIDVDGDGSLAGAWVLPASLLEERMAKTQGPVSVVFHGYDQLSAARLCQDAKIAGKSARVVFGGREWLQARQGKSAWDWLIVPADTLATNLLSGGLRGLFVGEGKVVVGKGFDKAPLDDPRQLATWLIEQRQTKLEPVVLFVGAEYQQQFFEFFSTNPMPGVFLSFDRAETVRDILNKHASFSADDQARLLNYYCN